MLCEWPVRRGLCGRHEDTILRDGGAIKCVVLERNSVVSS